MMPPLDSTMAEARRVAGNPTRQRTEAATRRAALAVLKPLDVVQVVDTETDRALPHVPLWDVEATADGARVYLLSDWRRGPHGWVHHQKRFDADGCELDAAGAVVPKGRVLTAPVLPRDEARKLRLALWARWNAAIVDAEAQLAGEAAEAVAMCRQGLPQGLREVLERGDDWQPPEAQPSPLTWEPLPLEGEAGAAVREAAIAIARGRAHEAGLSAELTEVAVAVELAQVPTTDAHVAVTLARLPVEVVRRALAMAEALRERDGRERILSPGE